MQTIFESRYNGNAGTVSARHSIEDFDSATGARVWRHNFHKTSWDYSKDISDNHKWAVKLACRSQLQKDPISIEFGGDSAKGQLWIVRVSD